MGRIIENLMFAYFFTLLSHHVLFGLCIIIHVFSLSCLSHFDNMQCHCFLSLNSGWFSDTLVYSIRLIRESWALEVEKTCPWLLSCHSLTLGLINESQEASMSLFVKWKWVNTINLLGFLWGLNEVAECLRTGNLHWDSLGYILALPHMSCRILGKLLNLLLLPVHLWRNKS